MIKSTGLHELRKNKGKMTVEIKIKKKVDSPFFNFGKGRYETRILSVRKVK